MAFSTDEIRELMDFEVRRSSVTTVGAMIQQDLHVDRAVRHQLEDWQEPTIKSVLFRDMYKRPRLEKAIVLLSLGFSIRETGRSVRLAKQTVMKLRGRMLKVSVLTCGCGGKAGHRGWCSWRFQRSGKRVLLLHRMHTAQRKVQP